MKTFVKHKKRIENGKTGRKHKKRKLWLLGIAAVAFLLLLWNEAAERQARTTPNYPQVALAEYLDKEELTEADYALLFQQTGMAKPGIEELRRNGREDELLKLQKGLFAKVPIVCSANTIITREERISETAAGAEKPSVALNRAAGNTEEIYTSIPCVEEGDILITFNSHLLGWRNGHAAMVVDAKKRLTLEARVLGSDTVVMSMEHWKSYPSFVVLRLKDATKEERAAVAAWAEEQLVGIPYRLTAGWGDWMYSGGSEGTIGTQCAHLVWYAYHQFGYDLDSDKGLIVTPRDLYDSPLLEVVQVYGMPIL